MVPGSAVAGEAVDDEGEAWDEGDHGAEEGPDHKVNEAYLQLHPRLPAPARYGSARYSTGEIAGLRRTGWCGGGRGAGDSEGSENGR